MIDNKDCYDDNDDDDDDDEDDDEHTASRSGPACRPSRLLCRFHWRVHPFARADGLEARAVLAPIRRDAQTDQTERVRGTFVDLQGAVCSDSAVQGVSLPLALLHNQKNLISVDWYRYSPISRNTTVGKVKGTNRKCKNVQH